MAPKESKETLFRQAKKVMLLAKRLTEQVEGMDTGHEGDFDSWFEKGGAYMFIASIFLYSATDDFRTVFLLLDEELLNGAFFALRRLFELNVDLHFIGKCPGKRSKQFLYFESIQARKFIQYIEEHWPNVELDESGREKRSAVLKDYRVAKLELGYKQKDEPRTRSWSRYSLEEKCRKLGWRKQYDIIYRLCSMYTHPSARGLGSYVKSLPSGDLGYIKPAGLLHIVAPLAIASFLDITTNVNRILAAGMDGEIAKVYQDLRDRGWVKF